VQAWLKPYAVFCALRDRYGTTNFHKWPKYTRITKARTPEKG
jgi:4-alpha-glucanotransferase